MSSKKEISRADATDINKKTNKVTAKYQKGINNPALYPKTDIIPFVRGSNEPL